MVETYSVEKGDTLSEIAVRHQIGSKKLKDFNGLESDNIRVGQLLKIPS